MGKITRALGNLVAFASSATGTDRTIFGSLVQSDDLTANISTEFKEGWGIIGPSDKPPLEDFNGAMFTHGQLLAYLHQMGVPEWDGGQEFQIGSISNRNGALYSCKTADHVSATPPESDAVNWEWIGGYDVILPLGVYTSGSYIIPNSRSWSDYSRIEVIALGSDAFPSEATNTVIVTEEHIAANPTDWRSASVTGSTEVSRILATSATGFDVARSGTDAIRQVIGFRKPGVS